MNPEEESVKTVTETRNGVDMAFAAFTHIHYKGAGFMKTMKMISGFVYYMRHEPEMKI